MEPPTLEVDVLLQLDVLLRVVSSPRTCGTKKLVQEVQHFLLRDGGLLLGPLNSKSSLSRWCAALPWLRSQKLSDAHQMLETELRPKGSSQDPVPKLHTVLFASCTPATSSVPELDLLIHKPSSSPTPPGPPIVACKHILQGPTQTSHSFSDTARFPDLQQDRGDITVRHFVQLFRREHTENTARPLLWPFFLFTHRCS